MAEYELVREIKNLCRNNQMRDVYFEEIECDGGARHGRTGDNSRQLRRTDSEICVYPGLRGKKKPENGIWQNFGLNLGCFCDTIPLYRYGQSAPKTIRY